jgi:7 transmembrane receptor (rhodopsin family)
MNMNESNGKTFTTIKCDLEDELGYNLIPMYRILFGIGCITVPLGIVFNIVFVIAFVFRAKKVFNVNSHALLLSCLAQMLLAVLQGPIRLYFYYNHGCLPIVGIPLCKLTVYLDHIPTQINNFLVAQVSIERFFIVVKPFIFHRGRHQKYSLAIYLHYVGLFVAIVFPCLYYPIIMQNGAATIALDDPSATQICDLWYARKIYETFDLLITFVPFFLILITSFSVIGVFLCRKCVRRGQQIRRAGRQNQRRILFSLHLFLIWFLVTWSPWTLYGFFQAILKLTYSVYIDAITTFVVYLNYTFSSSIVLISVEEMRHFCFKMFGLQRGIPIFHKRVGPTPPVNPTRIVGPTRTVDPSRIVGPTQTVRYVTEGHHIAIIS